MSTTDIIGITLGVLSSLGVTGFLVTCRKRIIRAIKRRSHRNIKHRKKPNHDGDSSDVEAVDIEMKTMPTLEENSSGEFNDKVVKTEPKVKTNILRCAKPGPKVKTEILSCDKNMKQPKTIKTNYSKSEQRKFWNGLFEHVKKKNSLRKKNRIPFSLNDNCDNIETDCDNNETDTGNINNFIKISR